MSVMHRLRYLFAAALGGAVTLALLVLMRSLVATGESEIDESTPIRIADVTMPGARIGDGFEAHLPKRIDEPAQPPSAAPPAAPDADARATARGLAVLAPSELRIVAPPAGVAADGDYLPIVKVPAVYPRRAQEQGVTGHCTVEYTVTATGATRDARPVDCEPPGVFEESSVKAALRFKYKPRVVDGQPVEVAGVRNQFLFELDE